MSTTTIPDRRPPEAERTFRSPAVDAACEAIAAAADGLIPEAVWKDDASVYRRHWFAWGNSFFGELILKLWDEWREVLNG